MIVEGGQFSQVYNALKQDKYSSDDRAILIFIANMDVDSVCASLQLQDIFHKDDVHYELHPVESFDEVKQICEGHQLQQAEDLRTVFMVNCGATNNVREICNMSDNVRIIINDSHRPIWHGYQDSGEETIVLLDNDDPVKRDQIPAFVPGDDELRQPDEDDDDDDEDLDPQHDQGSPSTSGSPHVRPSPSRKADRKRRKLDLNAEQRERQKVVDDYYSLKCGYGKPASLLMLDLAHSLQYDNQFHIWLAILGVTDQFMSQHMDKFDYEQWRLKLEDHVSTAHGSIEVDTEDQDARDGMTNVRQRHCMVVAKLDDLRLTLYRHWSLAESMQYTSYTAARLQTWRDKGKNNLNLLFAKMAIPVPQATAAYSTMNAAFKESLNHQLSKHAATSTLNMEQLRFPSFELQYKAELRLSASDMVHALTAVLCKPRGEGQTAHDIFHEATNVLYCHRHMGTLKSSMDRAKMLAKTIVTEGGLAIQRKQVQGGSNSAFWYLNMADFAHKKELQHPAALRLLAVFLRTAMSQLYAFTKAVVVVGPPDEEGQCYVVSLRKKQQAGVLQNNPFAVPFADALAELKIEYQSTFDSAVFKVGKQNAENFVYELKALVNTHSPGMPDVDTL